MEMKIQEIQIKWWTE